MGIRLHNFSNNVNRKKSLDNIMLDLAKAFNTVPHNEFLYKLRLYGMEIKLQAYFSSFLDGCSHRVVLEGRKSYPPYFLNSAVLH